jgi:hypothetical protein
MAAARAPTIWHLHVSVEANRAKIQPLCFGSAKRRLKFAHLVAQRR